MLHDSLLVQVLLIPIPLEQVVREELLVIIQEQLVEQLHLVLQAYKLLVEQVEQVALLRH